MCRWPANFTNQCSLHSSSCRGKGFNNPTPIHIVLDCSCHQPSSLNDCLTIGAPRDNDLCALLVGFRSHCFGLSMKIERAFLHVWLHPDDRNYTRCFWLSDLTDPSSSLCVCCFKFVPFGANSSPFMLNAVLQYHLKQYNTPVSNDMLRNLYVDNIISSCETVQGAADYYSQARTIMGEARLNLWSWSSNSSKLTTIANKENTVERAKTVNVLSPHIVCRASAFNQSY